jgi:heat shock protein HslJ
MVFLDDSLGLARYGACAGYLFSYRAGADEGDSDDFRIFGSQALPNVGCPDPGEALDTVLPDGYVHSFALEGNTLTLLFEDGRELVYEPLPGDPGLEGGEWQLLAFVTVEALDVPFPRITAPQPDLPPRLRFEGGSLQGSAGCNDFSAPHADDGASLSVGEMVVTEVICEGPAELIIQEERFLAELPQAGRVLVAGDLLWIETGDDRALLLSRVAGP